MSLLPDDSYACFTDGDVMIDLNKDYGEIIYTYVEKYPGAVLTCRTNRIGCPYQKLPGVIDSHDIVYHKRVAQKQRQKLYSVTDVSKNNFPMSGMLMVIKKSIWLEVGGFKWGGMLGIDTDFFFRLQAHNKQILVAEGLYVYHTYRIDGSKKHLL
jgi:GT2 family glycosyltransferase